MATDPTDPHAAAILRLQTARSQLDKKTIEWEEARQKILDAFYSEVADVADSGVLTPHEIAAAVYSLTEVVQDNIDRIRAARHGGTSVR